ncbi:DUF4344 domain-containing metallopeptidase [Cognatishimia sp. 1_MG-2023]|uniref:DUF4344 domain-containing metallopeptidase n=1 Tax=Cognatishimia sp. 1_MG-2023 TaxID=3062642 RepID=UPI0026E21375|nr:DUF4344 domain-containing metallopeptidase [Cognatishimia sp. 1_MG-2023]MDO6726143.1 DUF4344 domain-containing metallopeptidase [Cognatishimia sp. 1_MG-2023]
MIKALLSAATIALACPAQAELSLTDTPADTQAYVENNLLGIFYHEFGHALIDILELPIFGQEEDAADVLSVFLLSEFYEEEAAVQLAYDTAFGFLGEADQTAAADIPFWDVHGPDIQRYYNLVCIFYGANPDERDDVAQDLGLPEERADYCPDEFDQAAHSWGGALDEIANDKGGQSIKLGNVQEDTDGAILTARVITEEIKALNAEFRLPMTLDVHVIACDEANAFYDPAERSITMCTEFADSLVEMAPDF